MKSIVTVSIVVLLLAAGWTAWFLRKPLMASFQHLQGVSREGPATPRPRPEDYRALIEDAERWRKDLAKRYHEAPDAATRTEVLAETRSFLETLLPAMMRCWLGTPWDFNGHAEGPGKERIACGYFVATVLRDAGFKINRYKVAKEPSQTILRTFLPRSALQLRVGVPYEEFAAEARQLEHGIHIIGLDTHVAFLVTDGNAFRFIHSSGSKPWCVVDESETTAGVLARSNYRVYGNLTADPEVLRRWLLGKAFAVGGR